MRRLTFLGALAALSIAPQAGAIGVATDGDSRFEYVNFGDRFGPFDPMIAGLAEFDDDVNDEPVFSHLEQFWFYFRTSADGPESPFPPPDTESFTSDPGMVELGWMDVGDQGFSASFTGELRDRGDEEATFIVDFTVDNTTDESFDLNLFNYAEVDVADRFQNQPDTAEMIGPNHMRIDDRGLFDFVEYRARSANAWRVAPEPNLLDFNLLNSTPSDWMNMGLPFGPADFSGSFQWTRTLQPGESLTVTVELAVNRSLPAPECPEDFNGDGQVGSADLATLLGGWGDPTFDLDGDGIAGSSDLAQLLGGWGPCDDG